jgi:hypothetical protein
MYGMWVLEGIEKKRRARVVKRFDRFEKDAQVAKRFDRFEKDAQVAKRFDRFEKDAQVVRLPVGDIQGQPYLSCRLVGQVTLWSGIAISGPLPITVGCVRENIAFAQTDFLGMAEVVAVRMLANFDILTVVWHFPAWFKLIVLSQCASPPQM